MSHDSLDGIRERQFSVDGVLPREMELINRFNVIRHNIREVLWILEYMGLVKRQRGRDTRSLCELIAKMLNELTEQIIVQLYVGDLIPEKAQELDVELGSPSLILCRSCKGRSGRVFEVAVSEHQASNFSCNFEFIQGWQTADRWSWSN